MNTQDVASLIQEYFKFIEQPTENEVLLILSKLSDSTTEEEFTNIVYENTSNTISFSNESLDMSATVNILQQIKGSLKK